MFSFGTPLLYLYLPNLEVLGLILPSNVPFLLSYLETVLGILAIVKSRIISAKAKKKIHILDEEIDLQILILRPCCIQPKLSYYQLNPEFSDYDMNTTVNITPHVQL